MLRGHLPQDLDGIPGAHGQRALGTELVERLAEIPGTHRSDVLQPWIVDEHPHRVRTCGIESRVVADPQVTSEPMQ